MRRIVLTALLAAPVLLAGCDKIAPSPPPAAGTDPCAWMTTARDTSAGRLAVFIDRSNSTRATSAKTDAPDYPGALDDDLTGAIDRGDLVTVAGFDGAVSSYRTRGLSTRPTANNGANRKRQQDVAQKCLAQQVSTVAGAAPADPGTDVLAALREAATWVHDGSGAKRVVLATDGLPTVGCADLTKASFKDTREAADIVAVCARPNRKEITAGMLKGIDVRLIGVGRETTGRPRASAAQMAWLTTFWKKVCSVGGAQSCDVSTEPVSAPGGAGRAKADVQDPVVGFAADWQIPLPAEVLFATDKWTLRSGAQDVIRQLAVDIRTSSYRSVQVIGHADAVGSAQDNLVLSRKRAETVADALTADKVGHVGWTGKGETEPVCTTSRTDDTCLQQNRRVVVVVHQA